MSFDQHIFLEKKTKTNIIETILSRLITKFNEFEEKFCDHRLLEEKPALVHKCVLLYCINVQ